MTISRPPGPVVVLGSVNMDLVTTVDRLPTPGETVLGNSFTRVPGGKGANQAIAAARAGGQVAFIGAVGDDDFGGQLRDALQAGGVSLDRLRRTAGQSGLAAISVDENAENTIIVVPGANDTLTGLTDDDRDIIRTAGILVCQLEIPMAAVITGAGIASAAGVPVLLNPSPVAELPPELLACVTVLVLNEGEAEALGAEAIRQIPHVVTTLGSAGARYRGPDQEFQVASPKVDAIDTTGAGDAFTGALAVAWTVGAKPQSAVERACAAGALATTKPGASSSPTDDEIEELVVAVYRR
jgi:ribokinase